MKTTRYFRSNLAQFFLGREIFQTKAVKEIKSHILYSIMFSSVQAALLASAGSVIGLGSDLVGSLRIPAAFTGIFAHKPTPG